MERFWSKVDKRGDDECWPWLGSKRKKGHGLFRFEGKTRSAHAVALFLSGKCPRRGRTLALHSCDNPPCCNPSHLRWGTRHDNIRDMVERHRGHAMAGDANPSSKLGKDIVLAIFELRHRQGEWGARAELGRQFGVSYSTISDIWKGYSWSSVTGLTCTRIKHIKVLALTS